jgi:hypothetical protein
MVHGPKGTQEVYAQKLLCAFRNDSRGEAAPRPYENRRNNVIVWRKMVCCAHLRSNPGQGKKQQGYVSQGRFVNRPYENHHNNINA